MDCNMPPPPKPPPRMRVDSMLSNDPHSRPTLSRFDQPQAKVLSLQEMAAARQKLLGHLQQSYNQPRAETVEEAQFRLHNESTLRGLERYRDPIGQLVDDDDGMPLYQDARGNLTYIVRGRLDSSSGTREPGTAYLFRNGVWKRPSPHFEGSFKTIETRRQQVMASLNRAIDHGSDRTRRVRLEIEIPPPLSVFANEKLNL
ncbi:hypothetical protein JCM3765_003791 [Sporobolomyces pararoseus]